MPWLLAIIWLLACGLVAGCAAAEPSYGSHLADIKDEIHTCADLPSDGVNMVVSRQLTIPGGVVLCFSSGVTGKVRDEERQLC